MRNVAVSALLILLAGCASSSAGGGRGYTANRITREEILEAKASNLWEVVNTLRPRWLQVIDNPSFSGGQGSILVYRDNVQLGGPEALRTLNPEIARELRWLDEREAAGVYSRAGVSGRILGAIVIVTRSP